MRLPLLICLIAMGCGHQPPAISTLPNTDSLSVFEPGLISDGFDNRDMCISPDGKELFYTIQYENRLSTIMHAVNNNGVWAEPVVAWFSGTHKDLEAAYAPDGLSLYFASNRPLTDTGIQTTDYNIWVIRKKEGTWSKPMALDSTINTIADEYYPSVSLNGNLYFTRDNGSSLEDIWVATNNGNTFLPAIPLPDAVNSKGYDFNAFIDPHEEFILFTSYKRPDDLGSGDLYISRKKNGQWQPAIHLGNKINSAAIDYCPFVSPDRKYLYFTSSRVSNKNRNDSALTKTAFTKILESAGSGSDDIYRISFSELDPFN